MSTDNNNEEKPTETIVEELSMETQILETKKRNFNKIHVGMMAFIAVQVLFLATFSEPLSFIWGGEPLFAVYNDDIMDRTARIIMIYHSIATPFVVATTFWCFEYFEVRDKYIPAMKVTLIGGSVLAGTTGLFFAYTRLRWLHEFFYFGLFLVFLGGVIFMVASWPVPHKFPDPKHATKGSLINGLDLENYSMTLLAFCVLVSIVYGALAAMEVFTNSIWIENRPYQDAFFAEEVVRILIHDHPEEFIVSHLHIQLALLGAMVTMIGYKVSKIDGKIYHVMLFLCPIGILTISYGAWVLNHYLIWVGAGILILCTIALCVNGLMNISKEHLGDKYATAKRGKRLAAMLSDGALFGFYWVLLFAQIVVTICGISVGLRTREIFRQHEYVDVEYDFNVGHWHVLAVLLACVILLLALNHFQKEDTKLKNWSSWLVTVGGTIAFSFANAYMMRHPDTNKMPTMILTFVGVWIMMAGFVTSYIVIFKAYKKERIALKEA